MARDEDAALAAVAAAAGIGLAVWYLFFREPPPAEEPGGGGGGAGIGGIFNVNVSSKCTEPTKTTVTGELRQPDGSPWPGYVVSMSVDGGIGASVRTDAFGRFSFERSPALFHQSQVDLRSPPTGSVPEYRAGPFFTGCASGLRSCRDQGGSCKGTIDACLQNPGAKIVPSSDCLEVCCVT